MKEALKLTNITGEVVYIRDAFNISAVVATKQGDMMFTEVHLQGMCFRVKEEAQEVAALLGWEPKKIEAATG
jgi:hypothetical protein